MARFGGAPEAWIDLSTGINPRPYPVPDIAARSWAALPTKSDLSALAGAAAQAFDTEAAIVPLAGAQGAIQLLPRLGPTGTARVLTPTYNEHAASLRSAGWSVDEVGDIDALRGADLAVVVNPNNPDGRRFDPETLRALAGAVGQLVVDESFCDPYPEMSLTCGLSRSDGNITVLRSFGKFYGLAGLRLGFAIGNDATIAALSEMAGPWAVSGAAVQIGIAAYANTAWQAATTARLNCDAARLDALAARAGWPLVGGTNLFRLYDTPDAAHAQQALARHHIWTRKFPYSKTWLRIGLTDGDNNWQRLAKAMVP